MLSTSSTAALMVVSLIYLSAPVLAQQPTSNPAAGLNLKTPTYEGCFSSSEPLQDQGPYTYQALGWCQPLCVRMNKPVLAFSNGSNCWCGDELPAGTNKVAESECATPCNGFPDNMCGGPQAFGVYLTGVDSSVGNYEQGIAGSISASASSSTTPTHTPTPTSAPAAPAAPVPNGPSTIIRVASTVFINAPNETSQQIVYTTQVVKASGPNKPAIAAGVVVGVVILCALVGGLLFWHRQRKRKAIEDERRRSASISHYVSHGENHSEKPPSTVSLSDSRLEPSVMFTRRLSDGSIADNQDYSRRILKVTNPDGT